MDKSHDHKQQEELKENDINMVAWFYNETRRGYRGQKSGGRRYHFHDITAGL